MIFPLQDSVLIKIPYFQSVMTVMGTQPQAYTRRADGKRSKAPGYATPDRKDKGPVDRILEGRGLGEL